VSSTPQQIIIEAFQQLAGFHTQSATEMEAHLASDPEMWSQIGQSIVSFADNVQSNMPYGPAFCDSLRDLAAAVGTIGDLSGNVHATFRSEHEVELQRIEAPRADEGQWDIGRQS
jgi:hypothetical protein